MFSAADNSTNSLGTRPGKRSIDGGSFLPRKSRSDRYEGRFRPPAGATAARRIGFQTDSLTGLKTFFTVISWGLGEPVPTSNPEEVAMRFAKRRTSPPPPAAAGD